MASRLLKNIFHGVANILPDSIAVRLLYIGYIRRWPNLKKPRTFNEKIAWRKLYQHDPRFVLFADKIAVKDEIAKLVGPEHVIPTLWSGDNPEEIPFDAFPLPFVIKVNHGWGGHIFIKTPEDIRPTEITKVLQKNLARIHGHKLREWAYTGIRPRVLVEPMICGHDQNPPEDCRFFTYNGRVRFIEIDYVASPNKHEVYYNESWDRIPCVIGGAPSTDRNLDDPERQKQMVALAEKIGAKFDFVRVDLYNTFPTILFSETTFYPSGGVERFHPDVWDLKFGEPWLLAP